MDRMYSQDNSHERPMDINGRNSLADKIILARRHRGEPDHQAMDMYGHDSSPSQPIGSPHTPVSRLNVGLETRTPHPITFYQQDPWTRTAPAPRMQLATSHNFLPVDGQQMPMANNSMDELHDFPGLGPSNSIEYPSWGMSPVSPTGNLSGSQAQSYDGGSSAAVSNPSSQGLQSGQHHDTQIPARTQMTSRSPDSSTDPGDVTSHGASLITWDSRTNSTPSITGAVRGRSRRRMTVGERARLRALKAAGGACESCRRRKKKCLHKDSQLILEDPEQSQPQPEGSLNVNNTYRPRSRTRTLRSRLRPEFSERRGAASGQKQQQQRQNHSRASSYGPSAPSELSMFSTTEGGTASNTMTSTQSDATSHFIHEGTLETGARRHGGEFAMDAVALGHQFNGQLDQSTHMGVDIYMGVDDYWMPEIAEHPE